LEHFGFNACIIPSSSAGWVTDLLDGIIISGGDDINPSYYGEKILYDLALIDNARTDFELTLFRECLSKDRPVLGICNGMQLMNVALGGSLYQDIGDQYQGEINHKTAFHSITFFHDTFISAGKYMVNSGHHQGIRREGRTVKTLARSDDGLSEAIAIEGRSFAVGVQWHPERDLDNEVTRKLFEKFGEACLAA
jgi:putative glutamine amidotransferase